MRFSAFMAVNVTRAARSNSPSSEFVPTAASRTSLKKLDFPTKTAAFSPIRYWLLNILSSRTSRFG